MFIKKINQLPLSLLLILALTLGLAPFVPEPHLLEKISMMLRGTLHKPLDVFDLLMHGLPVLLLLLRLSTALLGKKEQPG